ncbi:MAG: formylglycine-generating enzyme family protein [Candidatus Hydrothermarchaeaceae archaeon]
MSTGIGNATRILFFMMVLFLMLVSSGCMGESLTSQTTSFEESDTPQQSDESDVIISYQDEENVSFINSIGIKFMFIPAGEFDMGSPASERGAFQHEYLHHVILTKPFYIGKYEVTQQQWEEVMDYNPSHHQGCGECPVENLTIGEVDEFIKRLNEMEGTDKYGLPTEAEWEYAARAGTKTAFSFGDNVEIMNEYAWCCQDNSTHPVGQKKPNAGGLYDVHGNVKELVQDYTWLYPKIGSTVTDPRGTDWDFRRRVVRGGSAMDYDWRSVRSANRDNIFDDDQEPDVGFRIAKDATDEREL